MITSLYFNDSGVKGADANSRCISEDFFGSDIKLEIALIREYSSKVELTAIEPTLVKNSFENFCISDIPFLIPDRESLQKFVDGFGLLAYTEYGSIIFDEDINKVVLSLIVKVLKKNIEYFLENTHNGVVAKAQPITTMLHLLNNFYLLQNLCLQAKPNSKAKTVMQT